MFINYKETDLFFRLSTQHNIMVLVGNGFDISVLAKYKDLLESDWKTTTYSTFFDYVEKKSLLGEENKIYKRILLDKCVADIKPNWSDFENTVSELVQESNGETITVQSLEKDLEALQEHFSAFLNSIVTTKLLVRLNKEAQDNKWASRSLQQFLKDLNIDEDLRYLEFYSNLSNGDLFNYLFVNFNYTELLDNYIFMDKNQFSPRVYLTSDRNFIFNGTNISLGCKLFDAIGYVLSSVIHPHGLQNIPRSMLFGMERPAYNPVESESRLIKSFWGQHDKKYSQYFEDTELFIIYGMSMGKTDSWWFDRIYNRLLESSAELIIYKYMSGNGTSSKDAVKEEFLSSCLAHVDAPSKDKALVKSRIYIVFHRGDDKHNFLSFKDK